MTIEEKLINNSMKINIEIINFKKELYEISQEEISQEELIQITENINYIIGSLTIQNLAINHILTNMKNDASYIEKNQKFLNDFLNNFEHYCNKYNIGEKNKPL